MRSRKSMAAAALLISAGLAGCGGEGSEHERTDATTRALLNQTPGGPATSFDGVPDIIGRANRAYLPDLGYNRGQVEAPLKVIEFSDFGCGFCRRFHEESFPTLETEFIDTGMIEWKFLPFITGTFENSLAVSEAAECVLEQSPAAYEAFGEVLWTRQADWKPSNEPEALARAWAAEAAVDMDRFDACLAEDRRIERVAGATVAAQQLGIRATPTFWIVGYGPLQGALPLEAFRGSSPRSTPKSWPQRTAPRGRQRREPEHAVEPPAGRWVRATPAAGCRAGIGGRRMRARCDCGARMCPARPCGALPCFATRDQRSSHKPTAALCALDAQRRRRRALRRGYSRGCPWTVPAGCRRGRPRGPCDRRVPDGLVPLPLGYGRQPRAASRR